MLSLGYERGGAQRGVRKDGVRKEGVRKEGVRKGRVSVVRDREFILSPAVAAEGAGKVTGAAGL